MKFSIVTPTFNAFPLIKNCVGSVRSQKEVEYQHIVQDACSSDGTMEWILEQDDINAASEADEGMYDAINRGWARADGDILSWLNVDEQYLPGTLEYVRDAFVSNPDVDVIYGDYIVCDAFTGRHISSRREIPLRRVYVVLGALYCASCTFFFRRRLLKKGSLIFNTDFRYAGDADLIIRLLGDNVSFLHIPKYLSLFGATGNNIGSSSDSVRETSLLRQKYRHLYPLVPGGLVRHSRHLEKLLAGCYFIPSFTYDFCIDETGKSISRQARALRFLWSLVSK